MCDCLISNRRGQSTIRIWDYLYKTQAYKIIEFDVYCVNNERDTAFQSLQNLPKNIRTFGQVFSNSQVFLCKFTLHLVQNRPD